MKAETAKVQFNLESLKQGDRAEFARLVETYYTLIYRVALRILGNAQDAEDVLQETFIKAHHHIKQFDGRSSISTWLYRIATNEALMQLRRKNPEMLSIEEPASDDGSEQEPLQIVDWCCLPEDTLMSKEVQEHLDKAIGNLPPGLRVVFILRDIQGLSTHETSQVLDLSEMAVKTRLSRARLRLREDLSTYFADYLLDIEGKHVS